MKHIEEVHSVWGYLLSYSAAEDHLSAFWLSHAQLTTNGRLSTSRGLSLYCTLTGLISLISFQDFVMFHVSVDQQFGAHHPDNNATSLPLQFIGQSLQAKKQGPDINMAEASNSQ